MMPCGIWASRYVWLSFSARLVGSCSITYEKPKYARHSLITQLLKRVVGTPFFLALKGLLLDVHIGQTRDIYLKEVEYRL